MTDQTVAEIVTFRLNTGVTPQQFRNAAKTLEPLLERSGGLIRRTLSCDETGLWTDHVLWASMADAKRGGEVVMSADVAKPMMAAIDTASVTLRHAAVELEHG